MILFDLHETENDPVYQSLAISNGDRQFSFLQSAVDASLASQQTFLSHDLLKALNFHAIACLHTSAGSYRPCEVRVGTHSPPAHFRVVGLMDQFINTVNLNWQSADPVLLATYVLWRLNYIHPFINGNGRTARAACYFVICVKFGGWLPGDTILPSLLVQNRDEYVKAHQQVDASLGLGNLDLSVLHALVQRLLAEQLASAGIAVPENGAEAPEAPQGDAQRGAPAEDGAG